MEDRYSVLTVFYRTNGSTGIIQSGIMISVLAESLALEGCLAGCQRTIEPPGHCPGSAKTDSRGAP